MSMDETTRRELATYRESKRRRRWERRRAASAAAFAHSKARQDAKVRGMVARYFVLKRRGEQFPAGKTLEELKR